MVPERRLQEREITSTVRHPAPTARPNTHLGVFVARWVLTIGVGLFAVSRFAAAAQAGYQLDRLQSELGVAKAQEISLQGEIAARTSASRLVSIAPKLHLGQVASVISVRVPSESRPATATAPAPRAQVRPQGIFAAFGALIQGIANEVARM